MSFQFLPQDKNQNTAQRHRLSPHPQHWSLSRAGVSSTPQEIESCSPVKGTDWLRLLSISLKLIQIFGSWMDLSFDWRVKAHSTPGNTDQRVSRRPSGTCHSTTTLPTGGGMSQTQQKMQFSYVSTSTKSVRNTRAHSAFSLCTTDTEGCYSLRGWIQQPGSLPSYYPPAANKGS